MQPLPFERELPEDLALGLPREGELFGGKYRIEEVLGVGGMAVVLAATHLHLDERVAIKLLLPQYAEDNAIVERFMAEGRAAIRIRSEHVVRMLDVGVVSGRPYLVMELLEGMDLDALISRHGPLPIPVAMDLLCQALEAIAEAHSLGIIHRDLKPANLFLTHRADGSPCVKVLDFGISKITRAPMRASRMTMPTAIMGSPHYMSPEQMQSSRDVDVRSDIWSVGAIIHELLVGSPPYEGDSVPALCARILTDPAPPLSSRRGDVPPDLDATVRRCMQKDPDKRFADVAELARALARFGTDAARASAARITRVIDAHGAGPAPWSQPQERLGSVRPTAASLLDEPPPPPMRSPMIGYLVGAMAMLGVIGGIGWTVVQRQKALHLAETREAAGPAPTMAPAIAPTIPPPVPVSALPPATASAPTGAATATQTAATPAAAATTATTTSATVPATAAAAAASPAPAAAPAAAVVPVMATATQPPASSSSSKHHARRAPKSDGAPARGPAFDTTPAFDVSKDPYAAPAQPAPAPLLPTKQAAPAQAPSNDNPYELFDDRK